MAEQERWTAQQYQDYLKAEKSKKEQYDPGKSQRESLEDFEKSQSKESPKSDYKQELEKLKEDIKAKYESVKSTGKEIVVYGKEAMGLSEREKLKDLSQRVAGSFISDVKSGYESLKERNRKAAIKREAEKAEQEALRKRLKTSYESGLEQRVYYKGYGGEVARAKQARLTSKERRAEEKHQVSMQKARKSLQAPASIQRTKQKQQIVVRAQPQVVVIHSDPFGLSQYSGTQRPVVRQSPSVRPTERKIIRTEQRRPERRSEYRPQIQYNPINDTRGNFLVDMGGMNVGSSPVGKKKKSNDPLGLRGYF